MKILIENDQIRLTGKNNKSILIYHNEEKDIFSFSICQDGLEIGCLPIITFYKEHTICLNNLPQGKSFID